MKRISSIVFLAIVVAILSGCAYKVGYNSSYLPPAGVTGKIDGAALVVMTEQEVAWVYSGNPTTFTGGGTTLTVPLGNITKQVALEVFTRYFERVENATGLAGAADYLIVVNPRVTNFEYAYKQLKNLGFAITPGVTISLDVKLFDGAGEQLMQKTYASGEREGASYAMTGSPNEKINKILHETLFELMSLAANDAIAML